VRFASAFLCCSSRSAKGGRSKQTHACQQHFRRELAAAFQLNLRLLALLAANAQAGSVPMQRRTQARLCRTYVASCQLEQTGHRSLHHAARSMESSQGPHCSAQY
jgi:hypothetical protein